MATISDVKIYPSNSQNAKVKARCSFVVGGLVRVNATIFDGAKGLFVMLPSQDTGKTDENGKKKYFDHVQTTSKDATAELNRTVIAAFEASQNGGHSTGNGRDSGNVGQMDDGIPF